jgi:hypothetical protein
MSSLNGSKYLAHENCVHYQDGWCKLNRIKVYPRGAICPRFIPKYRKTDSKVRYTKSFELKILEKRLNDIKKRIRYLKVKINNFK